MAYGMSRQKLEAAPSFHAYRDVLAYKPGGSTTTTTVEKHFLIQERKLSYRFYMHFHPYVQELVKRLIKNSVLGLQDADTDYHSDDGATLVTLPGSTRAELQATTPITLPDGKQETLVVGQPLIIPDGAKITLADGGEATLPGSIVSTSRGHTQVTRTDGKQEILTADLKVKLSAGTVVNLPNGTPITVPASTKLVILGGKPKPKLYEDFFADHYTPNSDLVVVPYPVKELDFTSSGAYSVYNWELFYHVPITVAIHLSKNGRFEEAMQWLHYIFDPTDDSNGPTPERFWKVKPFQQLEVKKIEEILVNLATGDDRQLQEDTSNSIKALKEAPFRPHIVARYRQTAYMFKAVMAYLDNIIAWGDSLFRQDTGESINEAMQLYVLAANILGPRPQPVPKKGSVRPQTYANLKKDLKELGVVLVDFEPEIPFDILPFPDHAADHDRFSTMRSLGKALYFCVPRNDKLLSYWDTVADRLFKIRNSLNIQGIFRQLPLFEPPIDPALLAKAAAAGQDIGAIVSGLNQPLPLVRFQLLVQKAAEICQEVKSLGNNLLSAMEKQDNEALAILRAQHEKVILGLAESVKYSQWQEAIKNCEGLQKSLINAVQRYKYYERQLGKKDNEIQIPELAALDSKGLKNMKFIAGEPEVAPRNIEVDIAQNLGASGGKIISTQERQELNKLEDVQIAQDVAISLDSIGSLLNLIPMFSVDGKPVGVGAGAAIGGMNLSQLLSTMASISRGVANRYSHEANRAAKIGGYARREQEWAFQSNLAAGEITQIFKQLRAAQIREAIAEKEWKNHQQQMKHAEDIEQFLSGEKNSSGHKKTSTQSFYTWMKREVKGLYSQCFQFAFDLAKKAERALQHELGNTELSFLQFGYLAGKEGLLAGEKLYMDIKRMEMAYHDLNQREYELTKHVSLLQVDPHALLQLRATGRCTVTLPEELFDMDGPGHYFRRIKNVAVSIPCVVGPYTSVNCTLTLFKSSIRTKPLLGEDGYARANAEDSRFSDHFGSLQSIVTSTGQNDSGMFETNLRDERYLPFELSGVVSEWQLELPADVPQFDYDTISDVILHIRYTAREGGGLLRNGAVANLKTAIAGASAAGSVRLFSVRHEFPSAWAKFKGVKIGGDTNTAELSLNLREEHYPFWSKGRLKAVKQVDAYARFDKTAPKVTIVKNADGTGEKDELSIGAPLGDFWAIGNKLKNRPVAPTGEFNLYLNNNSMEDLCLALTWQ